jgi:hypothetical protein
LARRRKGETHRIPSWPIKYDAAHLNCANSKTAVCLCQAVPGRFAQVCGDPATHGRVAHSPGDAACGSEIDGEEAIRTDRETPALGQMIRGEQATAQLQA